MGFFSRALVRKLDEMGFDVLVFVDLSFEELKEAIKLFASFIDPGAYENFLVFFFCYNLFLYFF